jgi:pimeloyl-ACP methyl ester carboxylesterase
MNVLRTPEDRFAGLPDFSYAPRYADADGLRVAYVEAGPPDGEPVLLLHGEPSWSFLYRTVIPVLADAGLRAIAADLVGFGRSDKPASIVDHSYERHVEWIRAFAFDELDLRGVTLVGQDWGGLIGLRLVAEHPDRFARVVAANRAAWRRLSAWDKPFLVAFSDRDPITGGMAPILRKSVPGAAGIEHPVIDGAGHFLQEDAGERLGTVIADFIRAHPVT